MSEAMLGVGSLLFRFSREPEIARLDVLLPVSARRLGESSDGVLLKTGSANGMCSGTDLRGSGNDGGWGGGFGVTPEPEGFGVVLEFDEFGGALEFDVSGAMLELRLRTCTEEGWSDTDDDFSKLRILRAIFIFSVALGPALLRGNL